MGARSYGQYCGFARAAEVLGERWSLLILRNLFISSRRFSDLQRGLPGIPSNVLTKRLKDLEDAGVIQRIVLPRPQRGVGYELTRYGHELQGAVTELARWGAKALGDPRPGELLTEDALLACLASTFRPERANGVEVSFELHAGDITVHAIVSESRLLTNTGSIGGPDLSIEAGPAMRAIMANELDAGSAIAKGMIHVEGNPKLLELFARLFSIDPYPTSQSLE